MTAQQMPLHAPKWLKPSLFALMAALALFALALPASLQAQELNTRLEDFPVDDPGEFDLFDRDELQDVEIWSENAILEATEQQQFFAGTAVVIERSCADDCMAAYIFDHKNGEWWDTGLRLTPWDGGGRMFEYRKDSALFIARGRDHTGRNGISLHHWDGWARDTLADLYRPEFEHDFETQMAESARMLGNEHPFAAYLPALRALALAENRDQRVRGLEAVIEAIKQYEAWTGAAPNLKA